MTTIAYDGVTLCTDSQVTAGSLVFGEAQKIFKINKKGMFAYTGNQENLPAVIGWLNGDDMPRMDDTNWGGILVRKNGTAMEVTKGGMYPACIPWTGGSGEAIAMTAIKLGKTAREAVAVAITLDVFSGGPIQEYKI